MYPTIRIRIVVKLKKKIASKEGLGVSMWPCLVPHLKIFHPSHRIFGHMYGTLNIDKKNKVITQFS